MTMFTVTSRLHRTDITRNMVEKYPGLLLPGSYLPSEYRDCDVYWEDNERHSVDLMLHEAGHALARLEEGNVSRLLDYNTFVEDLEFFGQRSFGTKAGLHEVRAI